MNLSKADKASLDSIKSNVSTAVANEIDRLFGMNARTNAASTQDQENQLLTAFRALDQAGRDKVLSYAESLVEEGKDSMKKENAYFQFESALQRAAAADYSLGYK